MIGERLSDLRKDRGMTQQQLADELHLTKYNISAYERDANEAPDSVKIAIANYFQVSIDYLLGLTDCPNIYEKPGSHIPADKKLPPALESVVECIKHMLLMGTAVNPKQAEQELDDLLIKVHSIRKEQKEREKKRGHRGTEKGNRNTDEKDRQDGRDKQDERDRQDGRDKQGDKEKQDDRDRQAGTDKQSGMEKQDGGDKQRSMKKQGGRDKQRDKEE